jgi:hypothetical protein
MNGRVKLAIAVAVAASLAVVGTAALAWGGKQFNERLSGFQEVPAVSTGASGKFRASVRADRGEISYRLRWEDLEGKVTQSHIHLGQFSVNGAISVFLCSNLGNGPPGTQPCPDTNPATIQGTIRAGDVTNGAAAQGLASGEFAELVRAIRAGVTYVNVHSEKFPGGEIRAQLDKQKGRGDRGGKR